jgi:hypothetical protein
MDLAINAIKIAVAVGVHIDPYCQPPGAGRNHGINETIV